MEEKKVTEAALPIPPSPRQYEVDGKDRVLLPLALLIGAVLVELFVWLFHAPGLLVPVLVAAWYAVLLWYRGAEGLENRRNVLLLAAVGLLSLTFALFSNPWFRLWNLMALPPLMAIQLWQWTGGARSTWTQPSVLWESFLLTASGFFCRLGAPLKACVSLTRQKRWLYVLFGLVLAVPVLLLVCPLLISADALFRQVTSGMVLFLREHLSQWMVKLLMALCFAPFLYGLLYALRRPERRKAVEKTAPKADSALAVTVLAVLDALYVFFIAVQFTGLFGGGRYLTEAGISYAEYARGGFFQLVAVAVLNLTLVMACVQFSRAEGRLWRAARVLATALVGASVIMLISAVWKMTLYVMEYGLSFKRFLTYWGMLMLAIFFAAALLKLWRKRFSFFKVLFAAGLTGWLLLNFINVDLWVAKYNVTLYKSGGIAALDLEYLANLSYGTLGVLEELPEDMYVRGDGGGTLNQLLLSRRNAAAEQASHWQTWSVSAQLAALKR